MFLGKFRLLFIAILFQSDWLNKKINNVVSGPLCAEAIHDFYTSNYLTKMIW